MLVEVFRHDLTFETNRVLLRPVNKEDYKGFKKIAFNDDIWKYFKFPPITNKAELKSFIKRTKKRRKQYEQIHFSIIKREENQGKPVCGCITIYKVDILDSSFRIGTWLGSPYQKSFINTECKYLLLKYAFNTLQLEKVILTADKRNIGAIKSIERIGGEYVRTERQKLHTNQTRLGYVFEVRNSQWNKLQTTIFKGIS